MSLTIQDFHTQVHFLAVARPRRNTPPARLDAFSARLLRLPFLGLLRLVWHAGWPANKCRASARRSLVQLFM